MTVQLIRNEVARQAVIRKLKAASALADFAPGTNGRLPVSYGIEGGRVAISVDGTGVRRYYDDPLNTGGILVHEEIVRPGDPDPVGRVVMVVPSLAGNDDDDDLTFEIADEILDEEPTHWWPA